MACRAGSDSLWFVGDHLDLGDAWIRDNGEQTTHSVGLKRPNANGLFDMLGNVWEHCWDVYDEDYCRRSPIEDPQGPPLGPPLNGRRIMRGGAFTFGADNSTSTNRGKVFPPSDDKDRGFRVCRFEIDPAEGGADDE